MRRLLLLLLSTVLLGLSPAETEDTTHQAKLDDLQERASAIDRNVSRLENQLKNMRADSSKLSEEITRLELERAVISGRIQKFGLELQQTSLQITETEKTQTGLKQRASEKEGRIKARLRSLYKRGNLGYAQLFLRQSRREELINAYHYAKVLTERDNRLLRDFLETHRMLNQVKEQLVAFENRASETKADLDRQNEALEELLKTRSRKLSNIRRRSKQKKRLLNELELEKEELNLLVRRLTETDADPMELRIPIGRYKGRLAWPAQGRIVRKFGVYIDPQYNTKRRHNGITMSVPKGTPVKAIYSGKVVFADWFKNYGNLVIIDHRDKVTSFYAHCDELMVTRGDFVERDQVIAGSGDTGSLEGPILHFEIRSKTKPENPNSWLVKRKRKRGRR